MSDSKETWRGKVRGMTPEEVEEFLSLGVNMYLACLKEDGSPYITVCWHEWRDGFFWVIPRRHSRWAEYLAQDPRVSFVVEQPKTLGKVLGSGNAELVERHNIGDEWVKIQNVSATQTMPLGGWWIRDSFKRRLTFKPGTEIGPGETLTVYTGHGTDTRTTAYWNLDVPMFQNPGDRHDLGDGAYLFDPHGDLRMGAQYPCLVSCSDPLEGAVQLAVQPRGLEYLLVRNTSAKTIDLYGYQLLKAGDQFLFPPGSTLGPGEAMRINALGSPKNDTRLVGYWGSGHAMFNDWGGWLRLENFTGMTLTCDAWGSGSC